MRGDIFIKDFLGILTGGDVHIYIWIEQKCTWSFLFLGTACVIESGFGVDIRIGVQLHEHVK